MTDEAQNSATSRPESGKWKPKTSFTDFLKGKPRAILRIDGEKVIGEIDPRIYGHCITPQGHCIYGGIWSEDGQKVRGDVLRQVQPLKPAVISVIGEDFASGYHWEDGIGPREQRPMTFNPFVGREESNAVGTDEYLALCEQTGAAPCLWIDAATGTPEEAARWVAYCNESADGEQGRRRAASGHREPYQVRLWGIGNAGSGSRQAAQTSPEDYVDRLRLIVAAMRAVDPAIKIVAAGRWLGADADPSARRWNETVLRLATDLIDYLSFRLYQPGREGWQDDYDLDALYYTICAAPRSAENAISRMGELIGRVAPGHGIKAALVEWNLWLPPRPGEVGSLAAPFTMRDALYTAGMLNAFQRQSKVLSLANVAHLVNVLPLIVTDENRAYATPIYYPFAMYRHMESLALEVELDSPTFDNQSLGNIEEMEENPYLDVSATRSHSGQRVVLGIVNRHPTRRVDLSVRLAGLEDMQPTRGWLLRHRDPLAENSFARPENVKVKEVDLKEIGRRKRFTLDLPPCSVSVISLET
jgi:alpha-N-arabinofuranosidase